MGFARRTAKFSGGIILGAAVSTAISVLLAPRSGPELKAEISDRGEEARRAGEEAEILETERLKREFRVAVNDPTALTGKFDHPGAPAQLGGGVVQPGGKSEADKAREKARKEQEQADKARKQAQKAEDQLRKDQEKVQKAREKVAKEEAEAAKARAEAERKTASV